MKRNFCPNYTISNYFELFLYVNNNIIRFLVNMSYAFQDRENLYLCLDYMSGGDLRYHIGKQKHFNEDQTRIYIYIYILKCNE